MNTSYIIYSLAVAWFTYHVFWMAMRIYQFKAFPHTYGKQPLLSLKDLGEAAYELERDIPAFKVIVPAFMETDVIEGTLYRLASMNYPQSHYEIHVVTYEDEPHEPGNESTTQVVQRAGAAINADAGVDLVHSVVTPAGYDGFFPGDRNADIQHIGKARGLNYALRCIHEENERDERRYFIGKMCRNGSLHRIMKIVSAFKAGFDSLEKQSAFINRHFNPEGSEYIGALSHTLQLRELVSTVQTVANTKAIEPKTWEILVNYIDKESSRFYLQIDKIEHEHSDYPELKLRVLENKDFLYEIMRTVEGQKLTDLQNYSIQRESALELARPILHRKLTSALDGEDVFQLSRKMNSRWVLVYDADADAPLDVMRHLAGRIMAEPDVMGFQGPVAPLLNYDSVHPLCRMGALWMAFWHGAAYPRLLNNKAWAHPLAGTNWCFRIEGFEEQNSLIRDCPYDESRRRFLLQFDPRQLTEDLETGIRNFSDWCVNAEWHPIVEMEQVPPTAGAMFRQHTRWSLGTLQTMSYIIRSRLPLIQKTWYVMYPLRVVFASSGPFITGGLIIAFYMQALQVEPIFSWWTVFLAFGNLIYIWAFIATFQYYYDMHQQATAVNYLYKNRDRLIALFDSESVCFTPAYAGLMKNTLGLIKKEMRPGGFIQKYMQSRYTDNLDSGSSSVASQVYVDSLKKMTPDCIQPDKFFDFIQSLEHKLLQVPVKQTDADDCIGLHKEIKPTQSTPPVLLDRMAELLDNAAHKAGVSRKPRWSRYHTQILIWAIPFVYFSVTPFFYAYWRWTKGDITPWHKTTRTVKKTDAKL